MTIRHLATLLAAAAVSMWASAQSGNTGLSTGERLELLHNNRQLLEALLDQGTRISDANTPLDRAIECQLSTNRLAREFREAIDRADADRAHELGDHLQTIVTEGFMPNWVVAKRNAKPGSPDYERVQATHLEAAKSLESLTAAVPRTGPLAQSKRLQLIRDRLTDASAKLGTLNDQ